MGILTNYGSIESHALEMSDRHSGSYVESGSVGSSRGSTWRERRHKDMRIRERETRRGMVWPRRRVVGKHIDTCLVASGYGQFDEGDEELKRLRRLVRDFGVKGQG